MSDKMAQPPWIELIIPTGQLCQQALVKNLRKIDGGDTHFIEVGAVKVLEARIKDLRAALELIQGIMEGCYMKEGMVKMTDISLVAKAIEQDDKARGDKNAV